MVGIAEFTIHEIGAGYFKGIVSKVPPDAEFLVPVYRVYKTGNVDPWEVLADIDSVVGTIFTISGLVSTTQYEIAIKVKDAGGDIGDVGTIVRVMPYLADTAIGFASQDLETFKAFYREYYRRHFPLLTYKVIDLVSSEDNDFYHEASKESQVFASLQLPVQFNFTPEEDRQEKFGLHEPRELVFVVCMPILEDLGLDPKVGDWVEHDNYNYEIRTVKRRENAYFGHTNYCFELDLVVDAVRTND